MWIVGQAFGRFRGVEGPGHRETLDPVGRKADAAKCRQDSNLPHNCISNRERTGGHAPKQRSESLLKFDAV